MRRFGFAALASTAVLAAAVTPPPEVEQALRARVSDFYTLIEAQKYRAAEQLVAPESRDAYYANEKPVILDFKIDAIAWENGFQRANVTMVSNSKMRSPRAGEFTVKVPYASHWMLQDGQWFWYLPHVDARDTPFGPMKVDPNAARDSGIDLKKMIANGPNAKKLSEAVKADRNEVKLSGEAATQTVTIESTFPGKVTLATQVIAGTGFETALDKTEIEPGIKARLTITRKSGENFGAGRVIVNVSPSTQILQIEVN